MADTSETLWSRQTTTGRNTDMDTGTHTSFMARIVFLRHLQTTYGESEESQVLTLSWTLLVSNNIGSLIDLAAVVVSDQNTDRELLSHGRPALQSLDIDSNPRLTLPPLHGTPTFANHPGLSLPPPTLFTRPTSRSTFQEIPRQASSNQFPSSVDLSSATRQITHRDQPRHRLRDLQGPFQQETPPLHSSRSFLC